MSIAYWGYTIPLKRIGQILSGNSKNKEIKIAELFLRERKIDEQVLLELARRVKRSINKKGVLQLDKFRFYIDCCTTIKDYCRGTNFEILKDDDKIKGIGYLARNIIDLRKHLPEYKMRLDLFKKHEKFYLMWKRLFLDGHHKPKFLNKIIWYLFVLKEGFTGDKEILKKIEKTKGNVLSDLHHILTSNLELHYNKEMTWFEEGRYKSYDENDVTEALLEKYIAEVVNDEDLENTIFHHFHYDVDRNEMFEFFKFLEPFRVRMRRTEKKDLIIKKYKVDCFQDSYIEALFHGFSKINKQKIISECSKRFSKKQQMSYIIC